MTFSLKDEDSLKHCILFYSKFLKNFTQFLELTFHLQLLQNTGYVPCAV